MKLNVDLSALLEQPKRMGETVVVGEINEIRLPPLSREGVRLERLSDLRVVDGLLAYGNSQVVIYIQDHSYNFQGALDSPDNANKFHVSECSKIREMRSSGRFERYIMTNNSSGSFYITGGWRDGEYVRLNVCKLCLGMLNYKGYQQKSRHEKNDIVKLFQAEEFFEKYSSFFEGFPKRKPGAKEGYTGDWKDISRRMRESVGFHCQECHVDLNIHPHLLHVHHINGVKTDNRKENLQVLCADCHSKAPNHERMHVSHRDRLTIARLRREQTQVEMGSGWDAIARYADPAVEGLIYQCRDAGVPAPDECGVDLLDDKGEVVANLELAWWGPKVGVAISEQDIVTARQLGWRVDSVNNAIEYARQLRDAVR